MNAQALFRTIPIPFTESDLNFLLYNIGSHRLKTKYVTVNLENDIRISRDRDRRKTCPSVDSLRHCFWGRTVSSKMFLPLTLVSAQRKLVFLHTVLIIRPNTTVEILRISLLLFTATCFGCPDRPLSGRCRMHRNCVKGERPVLYFASLVFYILPVYPTSGHCTVYIGLFISPSGISELDCATTKTYTAERSISIGRESLQVFFLY